MHMTRNNPTHLEWSLYTFDQLSNLQLQMIWQLRQAVFIVEQNCPYLDIDGLDPTCLQLCAISKGELIAYARLIPPTNQIAKIGRVIVRESHRSQGLGALLMRQAESAVVEAWDPIAIQLDAQSHLNHFYASLGYTSTGYDFIEDGIPHTRMKKWLQ